MPTRTLSLAITASLDGNQIVSVSTSAQGDLASILDKTDIPGEETDYELNVGIPDDNLKGLFLLADGDLTLKTNSAGDPDETINLVGGSPILWVADGSFGDNPVPDGILSVFVTNAAASPVRLTIIGIADPVPSE